MAIALRFCVKKNGSSAASIQTDTGNTTVTGDTLFVAVTDPNTNLSVSDTINGAGSGNTWTRVGTALTTGVVVSNVWRCENANGGTNHRVTVTASSGTMDAAVYFGAISGAAAASFDKTNQGNATVSPYTGVSSGTLSQANELAIVLAGTDGSADSFAESTGFTIQSQENNSSLYWCSALATKTTSATTSLTPSFTVTGGSGAHVGIIIATFKEASSGSTATVTPAPAALSLQGRAPGSVTVASPAQATLTLSGKLPTTSAFNSVRIREVLVNASGQAVANATDIGLRVWYSGICAGAPDVSLNGLTTDANGTTSWSIATGTLAFNQAIFYVAQNSVSYSNYTAARMIPSYE